MKQKKSHSSAQGLPPAILPRSLIVRLSAALMGIFLLCSAAQAEINIQKIIQIESCSNPHAYNQRTQAAGLMQITPIVLREYNRVAGRACEKDDLFNPAINIFIGKWYFERIEKHYLKSKGTIKDILICYHDGYGNWEKWKKGKRKLGKEMLGYLKKYGYQYD